MTKIIRFPRNSNNRALTLTELLVATVIVGIALLGIIAIDNALRTASNSSRKELQNTFQLNTAMLLLTNAANATTGIRWINGSGDQYQSEGILTTNSGSTSRFICFRRPKDIDDIPESFSDDLWQCFEQDLQLRLWRCPPKTDAVLRANITNTNLTCSDIPNNFMIRLSQTDYNDGTGTNVFYRIPRFADNRIQYIEFTLRTRQDTTAPAHPILNPDASLYSRVYPPGLTQ